MAPAVALQLLCAGRSCDSGGARASTQVPFCSLPADLRRAISSGFRDGRSPDVLAATVDLDSVSIELDDGLYVPWPGGADGRGGTRPDSRVPVVFSGGGVRQGPLPSGIALDQIAPTLELITGLRRDHPDVRTGEAIVGVADETATRLVVLIAWKGLGTPDLETAPRDWPFLRRTLRAGAGTLDAVTGSLPMDPAATLTTIGTGAVPAAHGITGTLVRDMQGVVGPAWSVPAAGSAIATFADDIDHGVANRARVGAVLSDGTDRGIVGGGWYLESDRDPTVEVSRGRGSPVGTARRIVGGQGFGRDGITDVLGVVLDGPLAHVDGATARLVRMIRSFEPRATFVIAGTGSLRTDNMTGAIGVTAVASLVDEALGAPVVEAASADGLFLDQGVLAEHSIATQRTVDALTQATDRDGAPLFADVYPSFAVAFSRYC